MNNSKKEERTSVDACQKEFANHLMLLWVETLLVVNDKEKAGTKIPEDEC
jgi:hypothetical protein